jgi:hypothetical protein
MSKNNDNLRGLTRRQFFQNTGFAIGSMALAELFDCAASASEGAVHQQVPLLPAKAKSIIYLFMAGGPSTLDLFDNKPRLNELHGQVCPDSLLRGEKLVFIKGVPRLLGSPHTFGRFGQSGAEMSSLLPHLSTVADEIAIVRSMHTTQFNHAPAQIFMNTGNQIIGRPSMGAWLSYGIGTANKDLPAFVVLVSGQSNPEGGKSCWGNGYLPTLFQGVELRNTGDPVLHLSNPPGVSPEVRRMTLDFVEALNQRRLATVNDPEIASRIASYEMAYKMQTSVPNLIDVRSEPESIHKLYGTTTGKASFANNCLLARRLVERGVRFVNIVHASWDHHSNLDVELKQNCLMADQPIAALLKDLKQRGLLDSTLVVWASEFGRTPLGENRPGFASVTGRDHHPFAFSLWCAGGGIKGGQVVGKTDDIGWGVVEDPVHIHDLQATLLRLFGINHLNLTYRFQGRDFRLTDVAGKVVDKMLL